MNIGKSRRTLPTPEFGSVEPNSAKARSTQPNRGFESFLSSSSSVLVAISISTSWICTATLAVAANEAVDTETRSRAPDGTETKAERLDPERRAQTQYERGVQAYRQRSFEDAIERFLAADKLAPRPALAYNVARAYEKLQEPARALQYYREYLRRGADASNRDEVERRVAELQADIVEQGLQQVTIRSKPEGAKVFIDETLRGTTPWTSELSLGKHELRLEHPGHDSARVPLTLDSRRAQDLDLALAPADGAGAVPESTRAGGETGDNSEATQAGASGLQPWPWVAVGAGGAALATAGVFELLRRDAESDAESARYQPEYYEHRDRMSSRQSTARVLLGVSAVLVVSGGVLALIDGAQSDVEPGPVAVGCDTTTCLGTFMGNF